MTRTLAVLFRAFFDICLFRRRPQDLPVARELLLVTLLMYMFASTALSWPAQPAHIALVSGLLEMLLLVLITWLFLYLRSVPQRWLQSTTALAGAGCVFSLLALPLFYIRVYVHAVQGIQALTEILILILVFWNVAVTTYIYRNALSTSYVFGFLVALSYIAMVTFALQRFLPVPAGS